MKKTYGLPSIIISAFLAVLIIVLIVLCIVTFDCKDMDSSMSMLVATCTAITSALSVIFAAVAINETRRQFQKSKRSEIFMHWYQKLIVDKHVDSVFAFFDQCHRDVDATDIHRKQTELTGVEYEEFLKKEIFERFTTRYTKINKDLTGDASLFDKNLSVLICKKFSEFQDGFFRFFDQKTVDVNGLHTCIKNSYLEIITILMQYDNQCSEKQIFSQKP